MGLESVFKLSLIMSMVDNLTSPLSKVQAGVGGSVSKLQKMEQGLGGMTKTGLGMAVVGEQITEAALSPVQATFETRRALGELSSLGVKDLQTLENAATDFSNTWAGTTKAEFISAAYDIKSGIASLSDEGVAQFTELSGLTAKATKSTVGEMTSLFATGYGIYKDYYSDMTDMEFGEMFSAGIAKSVQQFKTTGSGMAQAIESLGASATNAKVPLEEQLSILGMLQATMGGSEAGTKYNAFLKSAAKGGKALKLDFLDANNQLLSMPEILDKLRGKFGETIDATEKIKIQEAFGDQEAVALIDLLYNKTDDLQNNILSLYDSMGQGRGVAEGMANAMNQMEPDQFVVLQQKIQNVKETLGNSLMPTVSAMIDKGSQMATAVGSWAQEHQELVQVLMLVVLTLGGFITVAGTTIAVVGAVGLIFTKTGGMVVGFIGTIKKLPDLLTTIRIYGMYAGDGVRKGFTLIRTAGGVALSGVKMLGTGMLNMGRQALTTATTAMAPLITSVWGFTAALLANPITWIVIAIIGLIAVLVLLYNKCEWFRDGVNAIWGSITGFFGGLFTSITSGVSNVKNTITGAIAWFKESGAKIMDTFTEGIKSAINKPVEAVKGGLQKIRNMLPFSDAKTGPLSTLTLSGKRTMSTYAQGIKLAEDLPGQAADAALSDVHSQMTGGGIEATREPVRTLPREAARTEQEVRTTEKTEDKGVTIKELHLKVDFKTIKELPMLLKLLKEIEEFTNGNGSLPADVVVEEG